MAVTYPSIMFTVILLMFGALCQGQQLHVKHAPSYVVIQSQSADKTLASSDLHNIIAAPLGLNSESSVMQSKSVLKRPKANVLITVVTHSKQNLPVDSLASFSLDWDLPYVDTEQLMNKVQAKFLDSEPLMLDLVSANRFFDIKTSSSLFKSLPSSMTSARNRVFGEDSFLKHLPPSLNASLATDGGLLAELQMVNDVVSTLKKNAGSLNAKTPDLLSFTLTGLKDIADQHDLGSAQVKEAEQILSKHLDQVTEDLKSIYKDNVNVEVLTVPSFETGNVRKTRSLKQAEPTVDLSSLNLEIDYYADFPVTFNIVLWMMVVLFITIFSIAYGIWNMNPNLESILYRVPQDENKKNN